MNRFKIIFTLISLSCILFIFGCAKDKGDTGTLKEILFGDIPPTVKPPPTAPNIVFSKYVLNYTFVQGVTNFFEIKVYLKNTGDIAATNVSATLSVSGGGQNQGATKAYFYDKSGNNSISGGEESDYGFDSNYDPGDPTGYSFFVSNTVGMSVVCTLNIKADQGNWTDTFTIPAQ